MLGDHITRRIKSLSMAKFTDTFGSYIVLYGIIEHIDSLVYLHLIMLVQYIFMNTQNNDYVSDLRG